MTISKSGTGRDSSRIGYDNLLQGVMDFQKRFVFHPNDSVHVVTTLWIAHTYAINKFRRTPRLYVHSPEPNCGKSTQGELLAFLSKNGRKRVQSTEASLFRSIEKDQPTIVIDEADTLWSDFNPNNDGVRSIINEGYERGAAVDRASGPGFDVMTFNAYCPVALVGIDNRRMPETILTRSIPIRMVRSSGNGLEVFDKFDHETYETVSKTELELYADVLIKDKLKPELPDHLRNRNGQIWTPLFIVAEAAGGEWPSRVRLASHELKFDTVESEQTKMLRSVYEFMVNGNLAHCTPTTLSTTLAEQFAYVTPEKVGRVLSSYDVHSRKSDGRRVYHVEDVIKAVQTWIPGLHPIVEPSLTVPDKRVVSSDDVGVSLTEEANIRGNGFKHVDMVWGPGGITEREREEVEVW